MVTSDPNSLSTSDLPFKKRVVLKVAPVLASGLIRFLYATNRLVEKGTDNWDALEKRGQPFLIAVWHESFAVVLPRFGQAGLHALTSKSFDGTLAAALAARFGIETVRGSSSKGGRDALASMVERAPNVKALAMTIDGPRGPRRVAKHGMASLSQSTGLSILPIASVATKSIRLRSWDKTCIPKPFGTYIISVGEAIMPAETSDRECIGAKSLEIQTQLNELHEQVEAEYGIDAQL